MTCTFPSTRMRRNRKAKWSRDLVAETHLSVSDLILPLFVVEGSGIEEEIKAMPGVKRYSIDNLLKVVEKAYKLGIPAIALFPKIDIALKTPHGEEAYRENNLIIRAVKAIKSNFPDIGIICDVALDPYTDHGHDGILSKDGDVDNDSTIEALCNQALLLAAAGCDVVAPSDMMDGRIRAVREALEANGFHSTQILAYSAKYCSAFYGPFRVAVDSKSLLGAKDKSSYQMDFRNAKEALLETEMDIAEGADMVMVKPGMIYLDVIQRISSAYKLPVLAYQVSGEYAMLKLAAENGILDAKACFIESLTAFKRAGASAILTYAAIEVASWGIL
jgi:porphobilinogen synthase